LPFFKFQGFQIFLLIFNIPILDKSAVEQILGNTNIDAKNISCMAYIFCNIYDSKIKKNVLDAFSAACYMQPIQQVSSDWCSGCADYRLFGLAVIFCIKVENEVIWKEINISNGNITCIM
jgi:hypothetical protein